MKVLLIFLTVLFIYWIQRQVYIRNCFKNLTADIKFNTIGVFAGERIKLEGVFVNKKFLPLLWMSMKFYLSRNLVFDEEISENEGNDNFRKAVYFIGSYEKLTKTYDITAAKRGYYKITELALESGDVFGSVRILKNYSCNTEVYVYPQLIDPLEMDIFFNKMNGEVISKRHVIEDYFQLKGIRQYEPFDSLKLVNWNATARTGELKVNQYDFTTSGEVTIIVNLERNNSWDPDEIFEKSISLAASFAAKYIGYGLSVEILTNGCDTITGKPVSIGLGNNMNHALTIYENLARMEISKLSAPIAEIIKEEVNSKRKRSTIILISQYFGESVEASVRETKLSGFDIKWIIPKDMKTKVDIEDLKDLYIWEVKNL
jgi:uncharacterized protein (DUF58 family)